MRENLIELLEPFMSGLACKFQSGSCELTNCRTCNAVALADHLIANNVVPVVRCKDCKQFMEFRDSEKEKQGCDGTCYRLIMHCFDNDFAMVNATDYCSWGGKKWK